MAEPQKLGGKDQEVVVSQISNVRELDATAAVAAPDAAAASDKIVLRDVSDVIAWLETLKFDKDDLAIYKKAFKKNAIDGATLDELGEEDFKKMNFQNPQHVAKIMKERPGGIKQVPFRQLFMFADTFDLILLTTGALFSMGHGLAMPFMTLFLGELMTGLYAPDPQEAKESVQATALIFLYLAIGIFVCAFPELSFFRVSSARMSAKIRKEYLKAILRQDMSWFDQCKSNQLATRLSGDVPQWVEGIDKIGTIVHFATMFFAGFTFGFVKGWQLTVVLIGAMPPLIIAGGMMAYILTGITKKGQLAYAGAGGVAEETLGNMRTVSSLSAEPRQCDKYSEKLVLALESGRKKAIATGTGIGFMIFCMFSTYSLALWYGSTLITQEVHNLQTGKAWEGAEVLTVFFSVMFGAMTIGQMAPGIEALAKGRGAAFRILETIHRVPNVDWQSTAGEVLERVQGAIKFENVAFFYASRPDARVLPCLNLAVEAGQTAALVGSSGSGKSTTVLLLQRFYDPCEGRILIDGVDISTLNVSWLRSQFGLVSQEPVLFATTIMDNIRHGKDGATDEEIYAAARSANAHDFVSKLPKDYKTLVGERGAQLSGGQKQRIAIARAIIRDPRILLLDEATSALDSESEKVVQDALDKLMANRTTVMIAHRLSTVRHADCIYVLAKGDVVESGTYDELINAGGPFTNLAQQQGGDAYGWVDGPSVSSQQIAASAAVLGPVEPENTTSFQHLEPGGKAGGLGAELGLTREEAKAAKRIDAEKWTHEQVEGWAHSIDVDEQGRVMLARHIRAEVTLNGKALVKMREDDFRNMVIKAGITLEMHIQTCLKAQRILSDKNYHVPWMRVMRLHRPEWHLLIIGCIAATCHGGVMPGFALVFSTMLDTFYTCVPIPGQAPGAPTVYGQECLDIAFIAANLDRCQSKDKCMEALQSKANFMALMFFIIACGTAVINFTQTFSFMWAGENLTSRIRNMSFRAMARQPVSFFDQELNSSGALASRLADDASKVEGAVGSGLGLMIQSSMTGVIGLTIALVLGWKLTLVILAISPLIIMGGKMQMSAMISHTKGAKDEFEKAGSIASEAIAGVRTVAAFGMQNKVQELFAGHLVDITKVSLRNGTIGGFGFAFGHFTMFFAYFVAFMVAAQWIADGTMTGADILQVFFVLMFTSMSLGQVSSFAPNLAEGKTAISYVFELNDTISEIDPTSQEGLEPATCQGLVEFREVRFNYPSRPDTKILKGINITVQPGQKCALVGASGSGKSTCIALLERWYNPTGGGVFLDGHELRSLNLKWLRRTMALVSQEPVLFDGTIYENICFGNPSLPRERIEAAAKAANAHSFIESLPDAYDTEVGERGAQLSGGQKQRIAIARAIILEPKILLLDEATSALDNESEKVVQAALEEVMRGRTTLVVAHRLTTIQDADKIFVFGDGSIVESGTHSELVGQQGAYAKLVSRQRMGGPGASPVTAVAASAAREL